LAYEIVKGTVSRSKQRKFQKHFAEKVVKNLEKNVVKIVDPENKEKSRFEKIDYKIPREI
jgi:hypothetical protein